MEVSERNVDSKLTEGSAELTPLCEPCRADGKELEAHGFCNNCNEYMCPSCIKVHGKLTATKHHNVLGKQKMPTHYPARKKAPDVSCLELCKDHPPEAIKFFCPTHAQLCCGDCIVLDHRACKIDYIPRVAPSFTASSEFKAIVKKVETLEVACTNSERNLEAHEQSVLELNIIEIKKIQAFRVEINEYLDKQEKALIKFMDDAKKKDTDCIRRWREDINAAKLTLAETKSRLKDQNTASNIYIAARHAENLLNDIQTMIMKAKTENLLTGYKFCRDKKTEELLSWNDALGRVDQICDDVLDEISRIDKPCVIVAIAGLYRTGKSYLMNLLANSQTGFAIGDSIESKTKGIWVWCRDHPEQKNTVLMLLDTEGLGDVDNGDSNHDNHIFTLATLLCSTLVYNMKGAFDQDAVNKLTYPLVEL
ncbi:GBP1-like protein [Mya arenaria]|uniref:GBP1-like protein n=1 Tax=Mya arenaria TaxID=6604 RepID=A0ABY7EWP2_MYAAR|nr:GBP1-like protein [Mya arenaria]